MARNTVRVFQTGALTYRERIAVALEAEARRICEEMIAEHPEKAGMYRKRLKDYKPRWTG